MLKGVPASRQWRSELRGAHRDTALAPSSPSLRSSSRGAAVFNRDPVPHHPSAASSSIASTSSNSNSDAVQLYAAAVQAEREGRLNEALRNYRQAFKKDENVDKLYHRREQQQQRQSGQSVKSSDGVQKAAAGSTSNSDVDSLVFTYERTLQLEPDYERQRQLKKRMLTENYAERLMASFRANPYIPDLADRRMAKGKGRAVEGGPAAPAATTAAGATKFHGTAEDMTEEERDSPLAFLQRTQLRQIHITKLPDELLVYILSLLVELSPNARSPDMSSLERSFALLSRKARLLTLQNAGALFKPACMALYRSPLQIDSGRTALEICESEYKGDWRLMWIEQPRIRTDGVYISQITYVRRGALDSMSGAYYDPTHCVTYYRYLCFLPSGDVVSLLSHDIPSTVVPNLLASSKSRGGQTAGGSTSTMRKAAAANQGASRSSSSSTGSSAAPPGTANPTIGAGYTVGRWRLLHLSGSASASFSSTTTEPDASSAPALSNSASGPSTIVELSSLEDPRIASRSDLKYSFRMVCRLKSTVRGKNNKLEMLQLLARNTRTGEEAPIPIKNSAAGVGGGGSGMPSFYFSRVLSYD